MTHFRNVTRPLHRRTLFIKNHLKKAEFFVMALALTFSITGCGGEAEADSIDSQAIDEFNNRPTVTETVKQAEPIEVSVERLKQVEYIDISQNAEAKEAWENPTSIADVIECHRSNIEFETNSDKLAEYQAIADKYNATTQNTNAWAIFLMDLHISPEETDQDEDFGLVGFDLDVKILSDQETNIPLNSFNVVLREGQTIDQADHGKIMFKQGNEIIAIEMYIGYYGPEDQQPDYSKANLATFAQLSAGWLPKEKSKKD